MEKILIKIGFVYSRTERVISQNNYFKLYERFARFFDLSLPTSCMLKLQKNIICLVEIITWNEKWNHQTQSIVVFSECDEIAETSEENSDFLGLIGKIF